VIPKHVLVEQDCIDFPIAKRLKRTAFLSKGTMYEEIPVGGEELSALKSSDCTISQMKSTIVVTKKDGFLLYKGGEGTDNPACDYEIELIWGCLHRCSFCQDIYFLDDTPYIKIYPDLKEVFKEVKRIVEMSEKDFIVFETGSVTDLLALEPYTGILKDMISFWSTELASYSQLQFLTKSSKIEKILGLEHNGAVRIGFSINLPEFTRKYAKGTATSTQLQTAMRNVIADGYHLHLSFSPIFYREGILQKYEILFREMKAFLSQCDGFTESDLTVEAIIFFQKKSGEYLIRQHYPELSKELLQYCEYRGSGSAQRYGYPQRIYDELLPFVKHCFDTYFPAAQVYFIT